MPGDFDSDAMLAFIGQMGKEVDNLKTKIAGLNEAGGKGMGNLADQTDRFGKTLQRYATGSVKTMDAAVAGLTKTLVGAGGLALGMAGVAKAFDAFAVGELKIKNFAINTGFSVDTIKNLRVQLSAAGVDAGSASQGIASIGSKLQEVLALQETSPFYKTLQASEPAMAEHIRLLMNAGKQQEALNYLQKRYNEGGERFKAWLPTATGMSRAAFEAGKVGMQGLIAPWKFNDDEAAKYHKTMTNLETIGTGVWTRMTYTMLESINKMIGGEEGMKALNKSAEEFAAGFKNFFNTYVLETLKTTKQEFGWVVDAIAKVDEYINSLIGDDKDKEGGGDSTGKLMQMFRRKMGLVRPGEVDGRAYTPPPASTPPAASGAEQGGGIWNWIKKNISFTSEAAASTLPPGTMPGLQKEVLETDKESAKMLADVRDVLQKWDQLREGVTAGAGGTQTASLGPGGGAKGATGGAGARGDGSSTSTGGPPGEPGADTAGTQGSEYLAARRAGQLKEIENNPQLKLQIAGMVTREHEQDPVAVIESLANRTDYVNTERAKKGLPPISLQQMLLGKPGGKSFYGPIRRGMLPAAMAELSKDPSRLEKIYTALDKVYKGSNVLEGATDQGSGNDPNVGWAGGRKIRFGETYNDFGGGPGGHEGARQWREQVQKEAREGVSRDAARQVDKIDKSLRTASNGGSSTTSTARVDIDFGNRVSPGALMSGASPFIKTNIHRSPQAPIAGGGVADFNQYSFE
jgi:hypothetical protein